MDLFLNRARMFSLLSSLELDFRRCIENFLLVHSFEEQILGPAYKTALERAGVDLDRGASETSILDYLDLNDEIEILNRHRTLLPDSIANSISKLSVELQKLVPIRNRVMHTRSLLVDDPTDLEITIRELIREGFDGPALKEALRRLEDFPDWSPPDFSPIPSNRVLNNLPMPDYDETGLIGRRKAVAEIKAELIKMGRRGRTPVLTIIGPGGLGKTALALEALYDLVEDDQCPFEFISWVSLKTERLTESGVTSIVDAVRSVDAAISVLASPLDSDSGVTVQQLASALETLDVNALLVIDNLETVSGAEVLSLIETLPESVSFLLTSREGLGQIEKQYRLDPLDDNHAVQLLRSAFRVRRLARFAAMEEDSAQEAVRALGYSPLGIKWFVSGVEVGKDPSELLRRPDDLVTFCVKNVFDSLDSRASSVGVALVAVARAMTVAELRVLLPDYSGDDLRRSLQQLLRRMFVQQALVDGQLLETFEATHALRSYVLSAEAAKEAELSLVRQLDEEYRRADDRLRIEASGDPLRPNVIQGAFEHPGVPNLLRTALSHSKKGESSQAILLLDTAEELDPEYWEVLRVRGFVLSTNGQAAAASAAFERAVQLAPNEYFRAIVKHFFADHLLREEFNSIRGEALARESHSVLSSTKSSILLGKALTYLGKYEEAEDLLLSAMEERDQRSYLIATTLLLDCLRRHAEHDINQDGNPLLAIRRLQFVLEIAEQAVDGNLPDLKLVDKVQSAISDYIRYLSYYPDLLREINVTDLLRRTIRFRHLNPNGRHLEYVTSAVRRLVERKPEVADLDECQILLQGPLGTESVGSSFASTDEGTRKTGSMKNWLPEKHYGFIATEDFPENIFTHVSELIKLSDEIFLAPGALVTFRPRVGPNGQERASDLQILNTSPSLLLSRDVSVTRVGPGGKFVLSQDRISGATVFIGSHTMERKNWAKVLVGSRLRVDVAIDELGRFRANSAVIAD